jgi:hypothetical protein
MSSVSESSGSNINVDTSAEYNATPLTLVDGDNTQLQTDINGRLLTTETNSADIKTAVESIDLKDFATETTLAAAAADLGLIEGKDFATETTLAAAAADLGLIEGKDFATETTLAAMAADIVSLEAKDFATETTLDAVKTAVESLAASYAGMSVVDFIDTPTGPVLDASSTNIQDNAGVFVEVVASLAGSVKKIRVSDTTGQFIGVYVGAPAAEVLAFIINPGMSNEIDHELAAASRISVRSMGTDDIVEGLLCLQFLG